MAKNTKKEPVVVEGITLQEVAAEMNDVMQYGMNAVTAVLERPEEQIDVDQDEEALMEDILKNAEADLRPEDEEAFSEDAWNWFLDNGITPGGEEELEAEPEAPAKPANKNKEKTAAAPAKAEKAPAKPASKPAKAADGEKKPGIKKAMVPGGNEAKAIELAKEGCNLEDFIEEYTAIYAASGNNDKEYAAKRAKIYYKIGYQRAGLELPDADTKAPAKGKAPAKAAAPAPAPKGRGRQRDPEPVEEPEDDVPAEKPRRGRR